MSTTIDQRVVEMQFDNRQFEKNVQTSLSTLDQLKQSLNLDGATRGLENIGSAAKNISMAGLNGAVDTVRSKFSALEVMAVTALANITNSAVNAAKRIASSFTIDPITTGFKEYETQINAVQTILANTQSTTKQVVKQNSAEIQAASASALQSLEQSNDAALKSLKKTHKEELRSYQDLADDELDILDDKHDAEMDALEKALDEELKLFKQSHQEKLDLYQEEYMEKLKVVDEERYAKIKAIDDEIAAINGLTKAEEEALKLSEQEAKLKELQDAVDNAVNNEARVKAEARLSEYKEKLAREELLKEREAKIAELELDKDNIEKEYDLIKENLKAEYEAKVSEEKDLYELKLEQLNEEHTERKKALDKTHEEEKKLIKRRLELEKEAIQERQDAEIDALNASHKVALSNMAARANTAQMETVTVEPSTIEDVNKALDELNKYADKTIYNFTEMTRNIGTFTAAGIDLDTSVAAIKGIANLAAVSGSTSQQASTAMYQLSQAMAAGTVKLMDWNSVVNAGMGGQVFQDALKATAKAHGVAVDEIIAKNGSFRESLREGWITTDILTETLSKMTKSGAAEYLSKLTGIEEGQISTVQELVASNKDGTASYEDLAKQLSATGKITQEEALNILKMADNAEDAATKVKTFTQLFDTLKEAAQSGWTQSWEIIVGDFEEAKELLTEVSDIFGGIINNSSDARNTMLQGWKDLGGRTALIEGVRHAFEGIASVITPVKEAFREIFPPMTGEQLYNITATLSNLAEKLKLNETQSENLKTTFKGLFAVVDIAKEALLAVWNAIIPLASGMGSLLDKVLATTASWGEWLLNLRNTIKETDVFNTTLQNITKVISTIAETIYSKLSSAFNVLKEFIASVKANFKLPGLELVHSLLERVHERMSMVGKAAGDMQSGVTVAVGAIGDSIAGSKFFQAIQAIWDCVKMVSGAITNLLGKAVDGLAKKLQNANFDAFLDFMTGASLGGIAVAISKFLNDISAPLRGVKSTIGNVKFILGDLQGCLMAFQTELKADTLIKVAAAIGILTVSIVALSLIDSGSLMVALTAITTLFTELMTSMAVFSKISGSFGKVTKACTAMITMSAAILILSAAMKNLSGLEWGDIAKGLIGIAGLTYIMMDAVTLMSANDTKVLKGATNMVIFAAAIKVLASACEDMAGLSWEELVKGLIGVGVLLGEVSMFLSTAKFSGKAMSTATGIVILSAAIKVLASACEDFGELGVKELIKGLSAIGVVLLEIAAFTKLTGNASGVLSTGVAMVAIAASMKIFASAISDFGGMDLGTLAKGLIAMGIALGEIAVAMKYMPNNMIGTGAGLIVVGAALIVVAEALEKMSEISTTGLTQSLMGVGIVLGEIAIALHAMNGTLAGSAALLVASAALAVLTPVLSVLGAMPVENIVKGLLTIAGAFAVIGVAGVVLTPVVAVIAALSGALLLVSAAVLGAGVGLLAAGAGLSAIAVGLTALAASVAGGAAAIVSGLGVIITGIVGLIPAVVVKIAEGIVAFVSAIADGVPAICEAVTTILTAVIKTVVEVVPLLVDAVFVLLTSVLTTLAENAPTIIQSVFDILIDSLKVLAENIPMVVQTAIDIVLGFLEGIASKIPDIIQAGFDLLLSFINGITNAINTNTPLLIEAMQDLFWALVDAALAVLTGNLNLFKEAGKRIMNNGLVEGVLNKLSAFGDSIKSVVDNGVQVIKDKVSEWKEVGKNVIDGFIGGIKDKLSDAVEAAKDVASSVLEGAKNLLGINSPSKEFEKIGIWSDEGLINGLVGYAGKVSKAAEDVGRGALDAMSEVLSGISDTINSDIDTEPTIKPVLDLSNIEAGTSRLNAIFSRSQAMSISASMNNTDDEIQNGIGLRGTGNSYQFVQNNYSPKALSRVDIYRQTKNQFSAMERAVET